MRLQQVLLVVVVSFLSSTVALSTATENEQSKGPTLASPLSGRSIVGHDGATGRSLRARDVIDTEDKSTEDRGLWTHVKVRWWLETEKTDDYVKEALKLNGLKGEALTQNKNYKAYQYFVKKSEEFKLNKWYRHEFSTFQGWKEVGFVKITKASDLDKIRDTKQFSVYKDYVNYLDNYLFQGLKAGYSPPAAMVRRGTSEAELTARTEIMAEAGRTLDILLLTVSSTQKTGARDEAHQGQRSRNYREKMQGIKSPERQSSRRRYTLSEHDTKCDHYMKEKLKFLAALQDEVNLGRELVTSKYQINTKALMKIYEQLGYPLSGQEKSRLEEVIWQVNDNLDGAISFDEFVNSYVRSRNDRSGLEPSEIFFLTCFLMFDKESCGRISLDDAMGILYLKYGEAMEREMEIHFGKLLDEGAHFVTFTEFHEATTKRLGELIDQQAPFARPN
ncbi:hypothetical protein PF004_g24194 [Phytophthora fragariae]|uniref:RxLR effector protein n=2 Tax=Phytophthora fragariae TaxID=53985 RepID=A0A6G0MUX3_9STRA|nr:hypothetical protein PF004_g24194 [Phytophthora fragariae]